MKTVLMTDPALKNEQIFNIMKQIFNHENLRIEAAFDAVDTLSKAASLSPDILLIKTATDTLELVQKNSETTKIPAIVLLPPKSSDSYAKKMTEHGATATINMDSASILQVIDKVKEILGDKQT